jgi:hypothetical protein
MGDMKLGNHNWMENTVQKLRPASGGNNKPVEAKCPDNAKCMPPHDTVAQEIHGSSTLGQAISIIKLDLYNPKKEIDALRTAKGPERDQGLLGFRDKLDHMDSDDLRTARDYLGNLMADPDNKDDQFLGTLQQEVNRELDSRGRQPQFPPRPSPVRPFPPHIKPQLQEQDGPPFRLD